MNRVLEKRARRYKRKKHIRKRVNGTADKPRMSVFKSNKHLYVQIIDDIAGKTLVAASNMEKDFSTLKNNVANAEKLGTAVGERLKKAKIKTIVFDRSGYPYHGIVKALAEGTRKAGIKF